MLICLQPYMWGVALAYAAITLSDFLDSMCLGMLPYFLGVGLSYAAITYCYFCVAFGGYWAFGNGVASNIMLSVARPDWLVGIANLLVVIHVFGSYQVSAYAAPSHFLKI